MKAKCSQVQSRSATKGAGSKRKRFSSTYNERQLRNTSTVELTLWPWEVRPYLAPKLAQA